MDEYSIEARAENIFDKKTKEYFLEVLSSYQQGNYRSATVMLWSVAICDLLFKLKHMHDMYGDTTAKSILDEVESIQTSNPRSSEWEYKLVELVSDRTALLETADKANLTHLQQQRHLSAHPVLSRDLELHRPNKDTVRALIRNTLDGILTKPPIYTRKVFDEFVDDLASSSAILIKDETLTSYLESKYLSRADKKLELSLIRSLWKLVFKLQNSDCDRNRHINYRAMELLVTRNSSEMVSLIEDDEDYYSNIANAEQPVVYLVRLFAKYPALYTKLTEAAKIIIRHTIESNVTARCLSWFTQHSLKDHADDLIGWLTDSDKYPQLTENDISDLLNLSDSPEWEQLSNKILIAYFGASQEYDDADERFEMAIEPYLHWYGEDDLTALLEKIDDNSQISGRRAAKRDHLLVKDQCDSVLDAGFDYSLYRHFLHSLR